MELAFLLLATVERLPSAALYELSSSICRRLERSLLLNILWNLLNMLHGDDVAVVFRGVSLEMTAPLRGRRGRDA